MESTIELAFRLNAEAKFDFVSKVESIKGIENNPIEEWTNAKDLGLL